MSVLITLGIFMLTAWLAAIIGFAVNPLAGYALAGGVVVMGIGWLRGL